MVLIDENDSEHSLAARLIINRRALTARNQEQNYTVLNITLPFAKVSMRQNKYCLPEN